MNEIYEFLKKAGVYYLATVDGDQPHVRPFGTIDLFEGKLYIQTGKQKPVACQMKANSKVEISAMTPTGCACAPRRCWMTTWPPRPTCWTPIRP